MSSPEKTDSQPPEDQSTDEAMADGVPVDGTPADGTPADGAPVEEVSPTAPLADPAELGAAVEAILFVVEAPVSIPSIAAALQQPVVAVESAVGDLRRAYDERRAGVEIRNVAGGVRIYTRPNVAAQVELFLQDGQRSRLTQAALETLAVIAYRQPVTRSRVSAIRRSAPIRRPAVASTERPTSSWRRWGSTHLPSCRR